MTAVTLRVPDLDELPDGLLDGWDGVDPSNPLHRVMVALHEHQHLVVVPEWVDLDPRWVPDRPRGGWVIRGSAGLVASAEPVSRFEPDGAWELYVEHDEWETVVLDSEADVRWFVAVLTALDALAVSS